MYVVFDTAADLKVVIHYSLNEGAVWQAFSYEGKEEGLLLKALDGLLIELHKNLSDITRLGVVVGQGTFTGTRVAVTVANTLAFVLACPVAALPDFVPERTVAALLQAVPGHFAAALYSGEPRIGKKAAA